MIKRKPIELFIAGMLMLMIASPALAQMQPGHGMGAGSRMQGPGKAGMLTQITPQQQQTLQKIQDAHQGAFADLTRQLWAKQIQLQAAFTEDKIDESKIKSLTAEINKLRSNLFEEQVKMQVELSKAGLAYHTMRGGMMGQGMGMGMGSGMMGGMAGCPMMEHGMMGSGRMNPGTGNTPAQ